MEQREHSVTVKGGNNCTSMASTEKQENNLMVQMRETGMPTVADTRKLETVSSILRKARLDQAAGLEQTIHKLMGSWTEMGS